MTIKRFAGTFQALSPRYRWLCCAQVVLFFLCLGVAAVAIDAVNANLNLQSLRHHFYLLIPVLLLFTLAAYARARAKAYALREHDMSFYTGVIFRRLTVQPFTRLQHMEITRGPLERALGLATLKLFSAGGAQHTLAIPGLPVAEAERLRSAVLDSKGLADEQ